MAGTYIPLLRLFVENTAANFQRSHNLSFFGPKAVRSPRDQLADTSWEFMNAEIAVDRRMSLEMIAYLSKIYEARMRFLEELVRRQDEQKKSRRTSTP